MKKIKEGVISDIENKQTDIVEVNRDDLNLQRFFDDMSFIGQQIKDPKMKKPFFHYGDLAISNYLLWLVYAEIRMLNDKIDKWQNK